MSKMKAATLPVDFANVWEGNVWSCLDMGNALQDSPESGPKSCISKTKGGSSSNEVQRTPADNHIDFGRVEVVASDFDDIHTKCDE